MHQNTFTHSYQPHPSHLQNSTTNHLQSPIHQYSSQKNLFQNTQFSHSNTKLTHTHSQKNRLFKKENQNQDSQSVRQKLISMMREQIQIGITFYSKQMKDLIKEQAIQIGKLQQKIAANERELFQKNKIISQLIMDKNETPKKKLSITTLKRGQSSPDNSNLSKVSGRIEEVQKMVDKIQHELSKKHEYQMKLNKKIQGIQKGLLKIFAIKLQTCHKKIDRYVSSRQQNMQKIYASLQQIQPPNNTQQPPFLTAKLTKLQSDIQNLKEEITSFANKQFKYQNQQVDYLQTKLTNLNSIIKQIETNKIPQQKKTPTKVVSVNLNKNPSTDPKIRHLKITQEKGLSHTQNLGHSNLKVTELTRNQSSIDFSQYSVNRTYHNPQNHGNSTNQSCAPLNSINSDLNKFDEYENVDSCYSDGEQNHSSFYDGDQNFSDEEMEAQNQDRLVQVLKALGYTLPVMVEIDQTGYLKCLKDGMYLVDSNDDGFQLSEPEIGRLTAQGIIRVHNYQ